jgi:hypothetical protein
MSRWLGAKALCAVAFLSIVACSSPKTQMPVVQLNAEEEAILHVGEAYEEATRAHKKPPADVKALKPYLKKYGDPEKALISPNDGEPYQITWGVMPRRPPRSPKSNPFLVYEKTGKDGKRYAIDFTFKVRHLTDEEFQNLRGSE